MTEDLTKLTKEELFKLAAERNVDHRSYMNKEDLIAVLKESYKESPPPEPRIG